MQVSVCALLSFQLVLVLLFACGVLLVNLFLGEESIKESTAHGEEAVSECFDQYLDSIETNGEAFIKDISLQLKNHVHGVVDYAEEKARSAATSVERTGFMEVMETNGFHGTTRLPMLGWMILGPLEEKNDDEDAVVADIVVATLNSTEDFNNWVWFGLGQRNPNPTLDCDFYYFRNATDKMSNLWCLEELYQDPDHPTPSPYPHPTSPGIVRLQNATPREAPPEDGTPRSLVWMPLNFFVWTRNTFALTSVVSGVFGPDGTCQGLAAANVRFSSMSTYLMSLVESARYANLDIALVESESGTILGTSLGSAIYTSQTFFDDATYEEQELAANLTQMENPLARALNLHIEESYGSIAQIPSPLITSATLEGEEYFLSFDTFSRPMLELTIIALIPQVSITGPTEQQRHDAQISLEASAEDLEDSIDTRLILQIAIGVGCLVACAFVACVAAAYVSLRIQALVSFMEELRSKISSMVDMEKRGSRTPDLCEPLPKDFFPVFGKTRLKDLNKIQAATVDLCSQLLETWNTKIEVFRQALEQRQFTASIAHDIRNPLHGVLGIVSLMHDDIDVHKDKLPLLSDTLKHMATLLNDMVDLSKIQGGKVTHVNKRFDAVATLQEVVTLHRSTVASGGGTLKVMAGQSPLPPAYSDPVHCHRIVTNFVSNASKYAAGCEITLKAIVARREEVEGLTFLNDLDSHFSHAAPHWSDHAALEHDQYIVLACRDKGRGIPPEKLDSVFVAYQQTRDSDRYQGAGLGLAIVKGLAVEMGGGVGVQSRVGVGSLFWLVVPCAPPIKQPPGDQMTNGSSSGSSSNGTPSVEKHAQSVLPSGAQDYHVLVVDDTKLNLMLLKNFLTRLGLKSESSSSASDGLKKLRQDPHKFSLVLSDFDMPGMTGGEFCLEVRKDPLLCRLPFICTSGNHFTDDEKDHYKMDLTLMKPFTIEQVWEAAEPLIQGPSKWYAAPVPDSTKFDMKDSRTCESVPTERTEPTSVTSDHSAHDSGSDS